MAEIIQFPEGFAAAERAFRLCLDRSVLSKDAAEWIHADAWPRLETLCRSWQVFNFDANELANAASEKLSGNNMLAATQTILDLEMELYQARFNKPL